jgi:hypothetical protein
MIEAGFRPNNKEQDAIYVVEMWVMTSCIGILSRGYGNRPLLAVAHVNKP